MCVLRLAVIGAALTALCFAAPINVALATNGGMVAQSSTAYDGLASFANDGNTDGDFSHGSVSNTIIETGAWWEVTFNGSYLISSINVYNRTDSDGDRINRFSVFLYDANQSVVWSSLHNEILTPSIMAAFLGIDVQASRLKVQLDGFNSLQLAEVQAFNNPSVLGDPGDPGDPSAVPEPLTYAMMAGGLALMGMLRRRQQQSAISL